jgi:hypothetical protein
MGRAEYLPASRLSTCPPGGAYLRRACKAALAGEIDTETARNVFTAFARKKDILVEDEMIPHLARNSRAHHV